MRRAWTTGVLWWAEPTGKATGYPLSQIIISVLPELTDPAPVAVPLALRLADVSDDFRPQPIAGAADSARFSASQPLWG
jgi:hypothetical protein